MWQTGVIYNDTAISNLSRDVTTTELSPEGQKDRAQYLAALQQLLLDVSNVAVPPPEYARTCNMAKPQLNSTVEYLRAALADAEQ